MQNWEYCVVGPIKANLEGYYPSITFLTSNGPKQTKITGHKGRSENEALAYCIERLGKDGWELVGCGNAHAAIRGAHILYFKRPIR